jgi:methionyl-tRNA synthetase
VDALETVRAYAEAMDAHKVNVALEAALQFAITCNALIERSAPFKLAKEETPDRKDQLAAVLYTLAESIRIIAILMAPVLPRAAAEIFAQLNVSGEPKLADAKWGGLADHHQLGQPTPLFPRLEKAVS